MNSITTTDDAIQRAAPTAAQSAAEGETPAPAETPRQRKWKEIKALQRANKRRSWHGSAFVDQRRQQTGMHPLFGTQPSRKPARKATMRGK